MTQMTKFTAEMEKIFDSVFAGASIDPKTGKMVETDPAAFARADEALKRVLEQVAKEKWLMKESATDSLAHMAGLIKFEELNAGASSVKTSPKAAKPAPAQAPAGGVSESKQTLGFAKIFEALNEFEGDENAFAGDEVEDGDSEFTDAQMGAGDEGDIAGSDQDMNPEGEQDPGLMGSDGQQPGSDLDMADDSAGQIGGDLGADELGGDQLGGDSALDFDLSDLDSFDDLEGGQGGQLGVGDDSSGLHDEMLDDEPQQDDETVTGSQNGGGLV
jgi:hypothetical protein